MALRLAGEEFSVVLGLDDEGWLREIEANDSAPALAITQSGSGPHLKVGTGTPGRNPDTYLVGILEVDGALYAEGGLEVVGSSLFNGVLKINTASSEIQGTAEGKLGLVALYNGGAGMPAFAIQTRNAADSANTNRIQVTGKVDTADVDILDAELDGNGNRAKNFKMVLQCVKKTVNYSDISPVTVFSAPADTAIVDVLVEITQAFVGTSPTLDIGDGTDVDGFLPNSEIAPTATGWKGEEADTKGVYLWDATGGHSTKKVYGAATDVIVTIGGSGLTAGVADVYVDYLEMA